MNYAFRLIDGNLVDCGKTELAESECQNEVFVAELPADFTIETYTIESGKLVKASAKLIAERAQAHRATEAAKEIAELRAYLTETDYTAIKCGELGLSMAEAYPDIHAQRTAARARINELQEGGAYAGA